MAKRENLQKNINKNFGQALDLDRFRFGLIILIHLCQIDQSVTAQKIQPIGTIGADGSEAFRSKLKFQIQHEVFR